MVKITVMFMIANIISYAYLRVTIVRIRGGSKSTGSWGSFFLDKKGKEEVSLIRVIKAQLFEK